MSMMSFSTQNSERESFNLLINSTSMKFPFPRVSGMNVWKISKYLIYFYSQPILISMWTWWWRERAARRRLDGLRSPLRAIDSKSMEWTKTLLSRKFNIFLRLLFSDCLLCFFLPFFILDVHRRSLEGKITKWARWNRKEWDDFCKIYYLDFELSHSQLFAAVCSQTRDSIEKNSHRFGCFEWRWDLTTHQTHNVNPSKHIS